MLEFLISFALGFSIAGALTSFVEGLQRKCRFSVKVHKALYLTSLLISMVIAFIISLGFI
jgi:hypothetical protein